MFSVSIPPIRPRLTPGAPRKRPRAPMRLEQLETRLLLSEATATNHAGLALTLPLRAANVLPVTPSADALTVVIPDLVAGRSATSPNVANPLRQTNPDGKTTNSSSAWAIDKIAISQGALGLSLTAGQITMESAKTPHNSISTAEPLPSIDSVLVHGAIPGPTGPDVYRVPFTTRASSLEIELNSKPEQDAAGTQLDLIDEEGQVVGQLTVPSDASTVRVTLRPSEGSNPASVYVGISGVTGNGGPAAADYMMSVTRQGAETPAASGSLQTGSAADTLPAPIQPSAPPTASSTEETVIATIAIPTATDRPVSSSLPARLGRPMAGLFAFGDAAPAVVPIADTVDLALLELIPDEDLGGLPRDGGIPSESEAGIAHAASGELPLIALNLQACEEDDSTAPLLAAKRPASDVSSPVSDRAAVADRGAAGTSTPLRRRGLFQAGISLAAAVAFSLLIPEATTALHFARQARRPLIINGRRVRTED